MYRIKTLNNISDIIYSALAKDAFTVSDEETAPEGVLVRSASMHDMEVPESLLAVARAGVGYNNIPVEDYARRGIVVFNTPGANANAVTELVLLGMLMSGRKVIESIEWVQSLKGEADVPKLVEKGKSQFVGPELRGKTLGVIGLGAIGALVANAAVNGLGMEVIGVDPYISVQHAWVLSPSIQRALSEETVLAKSDFVSIHVPLSKSTKGMFNAERIAKMKPGAHLLNFSRAELVDGEAVRAALESGQLSSYVTDFPTEDMLGVKGVICIPHLGASTPESEENCAAMAATALRDYLESGSIHNSVNMPELVLEPAPGSRVLVIHENAPGLVNQISGVFAAQGVNINAMVNRSLGNIAVTAVDLDAAPEESLVASLRDAANILRVRVI